MAQNVYLETQASATPRIRRISWGAIFAGLTVTAAVQILLTLLGASIGAATINPTQEQNPAGGLAIGSAIWLVASALISIWLGACVAGRLSGGPRRADGMLHGVVTWSVSTLVMLGLLTTAAGALLGGTASLLSNAVSSTGSPQSGAGAVVDRLQRMVPQAGALSPTGRTSPSQQPQGQLTQLAAQDPELGTALAQMTAKGGAAQAPEQRTQIISLLSSRHGMSQEQAAATVSEWDRQYQTLKTQGEQQVRQVGEKAASGVSQGALYAFIGLLLGLLAAAWGGWAGTSSIVRPRETVPHPAT
jgi:hypothetical protein